LFYKLKHVLFTRIQFAKYSRDSYLVLILPPDGGPTLFQQGATHELPESPDDEELWPDEHGQTAGSGKAAESASSSGSRSSAAEAVEIKPDSDGIEAFAAMYIRETDGAQVPKATLLEAYSTWTDQHGIDGTNASWFGRKLANVVEYEDDRVRDGDDLVTVYTGIDLTTDGSQLLE